MFETPSEPLPKINISQQIAELKRERALRVGVYSKMVGSRNLKQSQAQYQMDCLDNAIRSLEYLRDNRDTIHRAIAEERKIERNIAGDAA